MNNVLTLQAGLCSHVNHYVKDSYAICRLGWGTDLATSNSHEAPGRGHEAPRTCRKRLVIDGVVRIIIILRHVCPGRYNAARRGAPVIPLL